MQNVAKVVVHFKDGRILKGHTLNFSETRPYFHLNPLPKPLESRPILVSMWELKAVFFVKTFEGNRHYRENRAPAPLPEGQANNWTVSFHDGEQLNGSCAAWRPDQLGFFIRPLDPHSNNQRVFGVNHSINKIAELKA